MHDGRWLPADRVRDYERGYDRAGIRGDDRPPPDLLAIAARADLLATSDLIRAVESARRLAPGREPVVSPLLREIELDPPRWIPMPLPLALWDALNFARWSLRLAVGADHAFVRRADRAADWLIERTADAASVVAVTHGGFRRLVARRLAARGWRADAKRLGYGHWSAWPFTRPERGSS